MNSGILCALPTVAIRKNCWSQVTTWKTDQLGPLPGIVLKVSSCVKTPKLWILRLQLSLGMLPKVRCHHNEISSPCAPGDSAETGLPCTGQEKYLTETGSHSHECPLGNEKEPQASKHTNQMGQRPHGISRVVIPELIFALKLGLSFWIQELLQRQRPKQLPYSTGKLKQMKSNSSKVNILHLSTSHIYSMHMALHPAPLSAPVVQVRFHEYFPSHMDKATSQK